MDYKCSTVVDTGLKSEYQFGVATGASPLVIINLNGSEYTMLEGKGATAISHLVESHSQLRKLVRALNRVASWNLDDTFSEFSSSDMAEDEKDEEAWELIREVLEEDFRREQKENEE